VDATPPDTSLTGGPGESTADSTPTFTFSASVFGATFECQVDGGAFTPCGSPHTTEGLADGPHSFAVRAIDPAGNTDPSPSTAAFTVDTTAPDTSVTSGAAGPTADNTPAFGFEASESSTFECRVDAAEFVACAPPFTSAPLADGSHTFNVRAIDALGHTDATPAERTFAVDTVAPDTVFESGPSGPTGDATPEFTFASSEPASTFECKVDDGAFAVCESAMTTSPLSEGPHTVEVRAIDVVGNTDFSPAQRSFSVDLPLPTRGTSGPDTFVGDGAANTFRAGAGDDVVSGQGGNDLLCGEAGDDTLAGGSGADQLFGDFCPGAVASRLMRGDAVHSASKGNDVLTGGRGNDRLVGSGGDDELSGGQGNDELIGGKGDDKLTGGRGRNGFSGGSGNDTIHAVNGRRDTVDCGKGRRDLARVDRRDRVRRCERVRRKGA
jgi:hypothetical protein